MSPGEARTLIRATRKFIWTGDAVNFGLGALAMDTAEVEEALRVGKMWQVKSKNLIVSVSIYRGTVFIDGIRED